MSLYMQYTEVPAHRSIARIHGLLVDCGAVSIRQDMREKKLVGMSFVLHLDNNSLQAFQLPARVEPVYRTLLAERKRAPSQEDAVRLQQKAENIAWRQLSVWLEAQLAIIGVGMVAAAEVFMPYCLGPDGGTMYEHWRGRMLAAPQEEKRA